jgi:ABC-type sugar transport system permease subunit
MVTQPAPAARRLRGSGVDRALPYLLLAPTLFLVLAVMVYPLIDGVRTSTGFYRFGRWAWATTPTSCTIPSSGARS